MILIFDVGDRVVYRSVFGVGISVEYRKQYLVLVLASDVDFNI